MIFSMQFFQAIFSTNQRAAAQRTGTVNKIIDPAVFFAYIEPIIYTL